MWRTRSYLMSLMDTEDMRVWTKAWDASDDVVLYVLGYIALFFTGLFLWFIWWIWNEPETWNMKQGRFPLFPRILTIPTVLVLGITSGFVANRWFVEREFDGMNLRPHLEEPWQEMAAFYPQMMLTVVLGLSAVWALWFIAHHFWRRLEEVSPTR